MSEDRIPSTDSISELARFWDTHDSTDFDAELEVVEGSIFDASGQENRLLLQLSETEAAIVHDAARARGIDEAAVVREWIREHARSAAG